MKKLKKLLINPEKVIKNEELVNLKGGEYDDDCIRCTVYWDYGTTSTGWACGCDTTDEFEEQLLDMYPAAYGADCDL